MALLGCVTKQPGQLLQVTVQLVIRKNPSVYAICFTRAFMRTCCDIWVEMGHLTVNYKLEVDGACMEHLDSMRPLPSVIPKALSEIVIPLRWQAWDCRLAQHPD